jgi:hypothetical protein
MPTRRRGGGCSKAPRCRMAGRPPYFPILNLLRRYAHIEEGDTPWTTRAKLTEQILTLDTTLRETLLALLVLLHALPEDSPFLRLDPPQRCLRTLDALKRLLVRESQGQPVLLVFEDLHWIDTETQPCSTAWSRVSRGRSFYSCNFRPEYQYRWGSKTFSTQLRLDPLPPASAEASLQALLGDDTSLAPLKRLLSERSTGDPFFLEESVPPWWRPGRWSGNLTPIVCAPASIACGCPPRCRQSSSRASTGCHPRRSICSRPPPSSARKCSSPYLRPLLRSPKRGYTAAWRISRPTRTVPSRLVSASWCWRRPWGEIDLSAVTQHYLGGIYRSLGDCRRAVECFQTNVTCLPSVLSQEYLSLPGLAAVFARSHLVVALAECGGFAEARVPAEEEVQIVEAAQHHYSPVMASWAAGFQALRQGDPLQAILVLERALALVQEADLWLLVPMVAAPLGTGYALGGQTADVVPLLEQAVVQAHQERGHTAYAR